MSKQVFAIEGVDRTGKSTLINNILHKFGYYQVIHFSTPRSLEIYEDASHVNGVPKNATPYYHFQAESFRNSMVMAKSGARLIFDRWHLGEAVYASMYRGYDGNYVFDIEKSANMEQCNTARLILLVEDFDNSCHFVDDGLSLGSIDNRREEQNRFLAAFDNSIIQDKRIICVTDPKTGNFKEPWAIFDKAVT
jgi:thymidylate kinase